MEASAPRAIPAAVIRDQPVTPGVRLADAGARLPRTQDSEQCSALPGSEDAGSRGSGAARRARGVTGWSLRLFPTMDGVDPALLKALEEGTYVVDPHAVAEAMLRRREQLAEARRLSKVLVAGQVDERAIGPADLDEPAAGADVA